MKMRVGFVVFASAGCLFVVVALLLRSLAATPPTNDYPGFDKLNKPPQQTTKPKDPVEAAAWDAGFAFGVRAKASGLSRPSERELDEFALQAAAVVRIGPPDRGRFVSKFKRAFGWGYWAK